MGKKLYGKGVIYLTPIITDIVDTICNLYYDMFLRLHVTHGTYVTYVF